MSSGPLTTADLVDMGDLDALLIRIDHLCADRDWAGVLDLRDRCRRAIERGRQLWPAASHAEYRLALEAPGREAAAVLVAGTGRFALGPLAEVAASTHAWADLRPYLEATPEAGMVAHERVVRGDDLTGDDHVDPTVLELPLRLQPWEPDYPLATYRAHKLEVADVPPPALDPVGTLAADAATTKAVDDPEATRALEELAMAWKQESNGTATAIAVAGDAADAAGAVAGVPPEADGAGLRLGEVSAAGALAVMAWAAASGGAHGRRRGMAYGRFSAWWAVAAVAGRLDDWPFRPDDLGEAAAALRWYRWDDGSPATGWSLRLAVEDDRRRRAWAVKATDHA
ncbi:MAG: hypothetical protein QOG43_666 [Actinomycetota bacterium]|nr:hypothetical protein [Actinomycetota bacterium]